MKTAVTQNRRFRLSGTRWSALRFAAGCALATLGVLANASPAGEPVYLVRPWFHRGPDVNLLTTPAGLQVAVDNDGRHLVDESINAKNNRFCKLWLNSIQKVDGDYYAAVRSGYEGTSQYDGYRISRGGNFLSAEAMVNIVDGGKNRVLALETDGFYVDYDPRHGAAGLQPQAWPAGSVKGLRARGGYEVDIEWKDGVLTQAVLRNVSACGNSCVVRYGDSVKTCALAGGKSCVLRACDFNPQNSKGRTE
jgi:hypothetical protein